VFEFTKRNKFLLMENYRVPKKPATTLVQTYWYCRSIHECNIRPNPSHETIPNKRLCLISIRGLSIAIKYINVQLFSHMSMQLGQSQMHYVNNGLQGHNQAVKLAKFIMTSSNTVYPGVTVTHDKLNGNSVSF
jgi:hypothetical protein